MGRPRKTGMDYFPHDTDAAGDEKIDAFRAYHGNDAYAFYFILCERIYRTPSAELDISNPVILASLARKIMVSIDRFTELLKTALELELFSSEYYRDHGVLTSNGIKTRLERVDSERARWRKSKEELPEETQPEQPSDPVDNGQNDGQIVFHGENPSFPGVFPDKEKKEKEIELKDLNQEPKPKTIYTLNAPEHDESSTLKPFLYEGPLDVLQALNHYRINLRGFRKLEIIQSFQGMMDDALILAAIKESGGQMDSYCAKVLENWNRKGYRKITDHPDYRPEPEQGGDVIGLEVTRGRTQRQRPYARTATQSAFEEAGRRSRPGKQVYEARE